MSNTNRITGAQALIRALEHEQVDTVFGLPGGCILPAYDPLLEELRRFRRWEPLREARRRLGL